MGINVVGFQLIRDLDKTYTLLLKWRKDYHDYILAHFDPIVTQYLKKKKNIDFNTFYNFLSKLPIEKTVLTIHIYRYKNSSILNLISPLSAQSLIKFFFYIRNKYKINPTSMMDISYNNKIDRPMNIPRNVWERRGGIWTELFSDLDMYPLIFNMLTEEDTEGIRLELLEKYKNKIK